MKGKVVKYNAQKGYGFIREAGRDKDLFVHISSVRNADTLNPGQTVTFQLEKTAKGLAAVSVTAGGRQRSPLFIFAALSIITTAAAALYLSTATQLNALPAYLLAVNGCTLLLYGYDKLIAGSGRLRVPEKVLQGLALTGGSPAALLAQKLFRHKTIKGSFQLAYWAIVALQLLALVLLARAI